MRQLESTVPHSRPLVAVLVLAMLAACDSGPISWFPLEADHYWHYDVARTTMDGKSTQKYLIETRPARQWNGGIVHVKRTVDGHQYFYRMGSEGIERVGQQLRSDETAKAAEPAILVLPGAPSVGDRWQQASYTAVLENTGPPWETLFRIRKPVDLEYTVMSVSDTVSVAAGEFSGCLRVVGRGRFNAEVGNYIGRAEITVAVTEWYAPNVGLVRSERVETTDAEVLNHGSIVMELTSFR